MHVGLNIILVARLFKSQPGGDAGWAVRKMKRSCWAVQFGFRRSQNPS